MLFEKAIVNGYRSMLVKRHDPDGSVKYFTPEELGLSYEPYDFTGDRGQLLKGYFYTDGKATKQKLILFEHGMGCGHRAYMREISVIVAAGYEVFAYDHTGTLASGGEDIGGLTQSLVDLDIALTALKASLRARDREIAVIGHSWGGYSTMNIPAFHKDLTHIVAMSGYPSVEVMTKTMMTGLLSLYAPAIFNSEAERFGGYAYADARYSLLTARTKAMFIHSKDDTTSSYSMFEKIKAALAGRENTEFLSLEGKCHNPTYTRDAVEYKEGFFRELTAMRRTGKLKTDEAKAEFVSKYDFTRMTEQDSEVWGKIFDFIES